MEELKKDSETTVLEDLEMVENNEKVEETVEDVTVGEETGMVVLQRMDETLTHVDSVLQYGVSLLIIFMLILLLRYIYKFFRMFF